MKRLFDGPTRVCNSLEDHLEAIRDYFLMSEKTVVDESEDYEKEIRDLEHDLDIAERERDDFEDKYEKAIKQRGQLHAFILENGLGSKLQTYLSEQNNMN